MRPDEISQLIRRAIPDAHVEVNDLTGGGDHFHIYVVSPLFQGKLLIDQHRIVQAPLQAFMDDGRIHAVQIKTETPEEWAKKRTDGDEFKIIR